MNNFTVAVKFSDNKYIYYNIPFDTDPDNLISNVNILKRYYNINSQIKAKYPILKTLSYVEFRANKDTIINLLNCNE